jgi:hypothetical protein
MQHVKGNDLNSTKNPLHNFILRCWTSECVPVGRNGVLMVERRAYRQGIGSD